MKKIMLATALLSFGLFSCKKDDAKTCDLNQANFAGTYKVTAIKYKADTNTPEVDEFATWLPCEKDDQVIFNTNGTVTYKDAGTVCNPPGDDTGVWTLSGSNINLDGQVGTVATFNCNSTTLTFAGTTAGELSTYTLARQ